MAQGVKLVRGSRFAVWASICIVVAALYVAQEVLIPLALAILFTFLLGPLVARLERWRVPRVPAVLLVVVTALLLVGLLGWVVERQFVATAEQLPAYTGQIRAKIARMGHLGGGLWGAAKNVEKTVKAVAPAAPPAAVPATTAPAGQASRAAPASGTAGTTDGTLPLPPLQGSAARPGAPAMPKVSPEDPLPVRTYPEPASPVGTLLGYLGTALAPLATAGMVVVFVIFMLLGREDLRDRLIRLAGGGDEHLTVTTRAIDDAASRISRFLLMQLVVNATYGMAVSLGLWVIGKLSAEGYFPSVLLWGLLCCVLRFIPYIGPWIAAAFPIALSFAMFQSAGVFVATALMFVTIELWSNNLMEPWLYGASTGMSEVAILVSAVFWTWLWGPIGLLMSTPLTVILVVLGKHVPALQFLEILLGDEPVLDPPTRLYQRLLARDEDEAAEYTRELLTERGLEAVYDGVLVPVLGMAERDRRRRRLDPDRHAFIRAAMREIVTDLAETLRLEEIRKASDAVVAAAKGQAPPTPAAGGGAGGDQRPVPAVVCLPAEDEDDEIAGLMLAELLERRGYRATAASQNALASEMIRAVEQAGADLVCVSALPPAAVPHSRYLVKRMRVRFPDLPIVVGLWTETGDLQQARQRIGGGDATGEASLRIATTIADAVEQVRQTGLMPPRPAVAKTA